MHYLEDPLRALAHEMIMAKIGRYRADYIWENHDDPHQTFWLK